MSAPTDAGGGIWSNIGRSVTQALHDATTMPPAPEQWTGGGGKVTVNKDNVLKIAKLFQDEADRMTRQVQARGQQMFTEPAMGDPVSEDMAKVMNWKFAEGPDSYLSRGMQYVTELYNTAESLKKTAKDYGYTEEDIAKTLEGPPLMTPPPNVGEQWASNAMKGMFGA
jgi:hypothetical protein